ncbi:MAG: 3-methyl-2-oxobutanoate hydroxymethyltransferase [Chloroflexota bacterium]|nr:3-methyl-2-oxobutanoate hydroxymethyltransferase [Chloroflexota bacterium]
MAKTTVRQLAEMKERGERIPMITAYDYTTAALADSAGIPVVLVGDSLGMVVLGYESTIPVTMEDIIHHTRMVVRGNRNSLIVADLPFMTYQVEPAQALRNAARLLQEGGAHTVKLEGGQNIASTIQRIVDCDIPVMAHIGVTPQSVNAFGGYRVRGRSVEQARQLVRDALAVEAAGAYAVVLELVPAPLAKFITERLTIPTIGIGAGPGCDGQVQVLHDMLGLFTDFVPRHARRYAKLAEVISEAFSKYAGDVRDGSFPTAAESFSLDEKILDELGDL